MGIQTVSAASADKAVNTDFSHIEPDTELGFSSKTCQRPPLMPGGSPGSSVAVVSPRGPRRSTRDKALHHPFEQHISDHISEMLERMHGAWVARGEDISNWLRQLHIDAEHRHVIDGVGGIVDLSLSQNSIILEGGVLTIADDALCRTGKSGIQVFFDRVGKTSASEKHPIQIFDSSAEGA
jgi:hypothetical protein